MSGTGSVPRPNQALCTRIGPCMLRMGPKGPSLALACQDQVLGPSTVPFPPQVPGLGPGPNAGIEYPVQDVRPRDPHRSRHLAAGGQCPCHQMSVSVGSPTGCMTWHWELTLAFGQGVEHP